MRVRSSTRRKKDMYVSNNKIIIKVFVKRKILSLETILSA